MLKRLFTRFSLIVVVLGLTACATVSQNLTPVPDHSMPKSITKKVSLGSMIAVPRDGGNDRSLIAVPPAGGNDSAQARVVEEYFSASGRHCVRVELKESGNLTRVICQREGGNWSFTRSLFNDKILTERDESLIGTPIDGVESNPAQLPEGDHSSVADVFGTEFETHMSSLPSFDGNSAGDITGTSTTAGPAKWMQFAVANVRALRDLVGFAHNDKHIAGGL